MFSKFRYIMYMLYKLVSAKCRSLRISVGFDFEFESGAINGVCVGMFRLSWHCSLNIIMSMLFFYSIRKVQSLNCECSVATVRDDAVRSRAGARRDMWLTGWLSVYATGWLRLYDYVTAWPARSTNTTHLKSTHSYKTCWIFLPFAFWS